MLRKLCEANGAALVYLDEDVESCEFSSPHDVHDVTPEGSAFSVRTLGQQTINLSLRFKPGVSARWVEGQELVEILALAETPDLLALPGIG